MTALTAWIAKFSPVYGVFRYNERTDKMQGIVVHGMSLEVSDTHVHRYWSNSIASRNAATPLTGKAEADAHHIDGACITIDLTAPDCPVEIEWEFVFCSNVDHERYAARFKWKDTPEAKAVIQQARVMYYRYVIKWLDDQEREEVAKIKAKYDKRRAPSVRRLEGMAKTNGPVAYVVAQLQNIDHKDYIKEHYKPVVVRKRKPAQMEALPEGMRLTWPYEDRATSSTWEGQ